MNFQHLSEVRISELSNAELAFQMEESYRMRGVNNEYRDNLMLEAAKRLRAQTAQ